jgi:hypothetical protein
MSREGFILIETRERVGALRLKRPTELNGLNELVIWTWSGYHLALCLK